MILALEITILLSIAQILCNPLILKIDMPSFDITETIIAFIKGCI